MQELLQPIYLAIFSIFFLVSLFFHFFIKNLFRRIGIVDLPDGEKKKHRMGVPVSGGISVFFSFTLIIFFYFFLILSGFLSNFLDLRILEDSFKFIDYKTGFYIGLAGLVVAAISFIDDLLDLPAWFRFVALIICSGVFISISGINLTSLGDLLGFGEIKLNGIAGPLFTIFCVVGVANAFNWIDGLDGLFSTQALIAIAVTFYFISGNGLFLVLFLIAFLPYLLMNLSVFGEKNRVFIGDHGAMGIGYAIGWFLVSAAENELINPMTGPWIIALVLLNAFRAMFKRMLLGVSLFRSDREHIHHFFLDNGFSKGKSLVIIFLLSIFLVSFGVFLELRQFSETLSFYLFVSAFAVWSLLSLSIKKSVTSSR